MAITVSDLKTNLDTFIRDSSTVTFSDSERFQAITEATIWLQEFLQNDHMNATYDLDFVDTVHYYKITSAVPDVIEPVDLRKEADEHHMSFTRKSPRELAEEIGGGIEGDSYAIEWRDGDWFLVVNHAVKNSAVLISGLDSTSDGGGTWEVDATNSDATNLTQDSVEFKKGSGSLNFDIDVSQSGNDKATIKNETLTGKDLSQFEDLGTFLFEFYIPDATNINSLTLYWGSDTSNYWSATVTTDIDGSAWSDGWNTAKVDWSSATKTSSPDVENIDYVQFDVNYAGGQGDDTDFRLDHLRIAKPETLTFHYISWNVGQDTNGSDITEFSATTDVPFFSGKYDQYRYAVAHKAAAVLLDSNRDFDKSQREEDEATRAIARQKKIFPSSKAPEEKSFKVAGVNFASRRARGRRRP